MFRTIPIGKINADCESDMSPYSAAIIRLFTKNDFNDDYDQDFSTVGPKVVPAMIKCYLMIKLDIPDSNSGQISIFFFFGDRVYICQ